MEFTRKMYLKIKINGSTRIYATEQITNSNRYFTEVKAERPLQAMSLNEEAIRRWKKETEIHYEKKKKLQSQS
jgi:hypothetical protein